MHLNLLKAFNLRDRKPVVKRVTEIRTRVNEGSRDSSGGGKFKSDEYDGGHECGTDRC